MIADIFKTGKLLAVQAIFEIKIANIFATGMAKGEIGGNIAEIKPSTVIGATKGAARIFAGMLANDK